MRIFGCLAYAYVPDQLRKKLDDKAAKCIFNGMTLSQRGTNCLIQSERRWELAGTSFFYGKSSWDWSLNGNRTSIYFPIADADDLGGEQLLDELAIQSLMAQSPADQAPQETKSRRPPHECRMPSRFQDYQMGTDNIRPMSLEKHERWWSISHC